MLLHLVLYWMNSVRDWTDHNSSSQKHFKTLLYEIIYKILTVVRPVAGLGWLEPYFHVTCGLFQKHSSVRPKL